VLLDWWDGGTTARLRRAFSSLSLAKRLLLPGALPRELAILPVFSLFAFAERGGGLRLVFLEALGCRQPWLAGDRDGSVVPSVMGPFGCWWIRGCPLVALAGLLEAYGEEL